MTKKMKEKITALVSEAIQEAQNNVQKHNAWSGDDLLNDSQTAKVLGISKGTLPVWRHKGRGPRHVKVGSNVRYRYSSLLEYIDAHTY